MTQLARFSLLLVALLVSGFPFGFTPAHADELPQDTNKIESLTPEQARKLAEEFPGVEVEFETDEEIGWWWSDGLPLQGLTTLNPKTAEELARFKGNAILLTGLSSLGVDTATSFAAYDGDVVVSEKVQKRFLATHPLSPESTVAWAVVTRGDLSRVPAIDLAIAKALAEFKGRELSLTGLTTLDAASAKTLAEFKGRLSLNGLTTLDADTAKALAEFKGWSLGLSGLTTLDAASAKRLVEFKGVLHLDGLTRFDADTVKALTEFKGQRLSLGRLTALSEEATKALTQQNGFSLSLHGLTTLDADTAKALAATEKWDGDLSAVTALDTPDSVAIAKALATRKGPLKLPNLKKISPKTLSALIAKEDVAIPLIETLELIQEPDGSVTEDFVIPEGFQERQKQQSQ